MNRARIDQAVGADSGVRGYAATARRCQERIAQVRRALEPALRAVDDAAQRGAGVEAAADHALRLALELDALERVQARVDAWLRLVGGVDANEDWLAPFGKAPA
ncbi:hypothetical protein C8N24_4844 [Solirubrobacter pauli]|uniref:Uncharacterized protein n=1 Tax=Solirubrobacter pauli TaxID=166793 RepID=A0A660L1M7_9ACTN|nr:hypothetical protein [Solirubrobacter pauli]RKQ86829.1 hypothetical protein C8N24_4844 [Solirubrobacter pauli]